MTGIDGDRLLADLTALRHIGQDRTGVHRPAFSNADMAARRWLAERMTEAGLQPTVDGLGNVLGRAPDAETVLLIGSHTDSVPHGGWLDGALGVAYGLEVSRALAPRGHAVDVVSFQDEEGTFFPCLGSRSFVGEVTRADLVGRHDTEGRDLLGEIERNALDAAPWLRLEASRYAAFLEAHIEQGPRLETTGTNLGIVTGIVGMRRYRIIAHGQADHAGTTPMAMRRDAGATLIGFADRLLATVRANADAETVWNVGRMEFRPGASNVVPAEAELWFEVRDLDDARLDVIEREVAACATAVETAHVPVTFQRTSAIPPVAMDQDLVAILEQAAGAAGTSTARMASGAGHDAMILAPHVPAAMIFVPSIDGRSHDVLEDSTAEDIVRGCETLAAAAATLFER